VKALYVDFDMRRVVALAIAKTVSRRLAFAPFAPLRFREVPEPAIPGPRWIKVRNVRCGLCASDVHFAFMDIDVGSFPAAAPGVPRKYLGHELVGEVLEAGSEAQNVVVGDRVALRIDWPSCFQQDLDPACRQCAAGSYMLCENIGLLPAPVVDTGGGFSPYMVMHRSQVFRIPPGLTDDEAVLLEPTAVAVHTVMKLPPRPGQKVLVIGAGTIGLLTLAVAKAGEPACEVCCVARYPFQAEQARRMGADRVLPENDGVYRRAAEATGARYIEGAFGNQILLGGFDLVYDTVGSDRSLRDALRLARAGGTVVLAGINFQPGRLDYSPIWNQEVNLVGINSHATEQTGENSFEIAARLLSSRAVRVEGMVTHRFALGEYRRAIDALCAKSRSRAVKIVIEHGRT
jgi:2-desacetyl-2-hydroxyethyl bacteriochlorophyllide A dehydrogenase